MVLKNLKKYFVLHPFLFALYPLLFFYSRNAWLFSLREFLYALGVMVAAAFAVFVLLIIIFRRAHAAAVATSILFVAFFSIEPVLKQFQGLVQLRYVAALYGLLVFAALYLVLKYARDTRRFSSVFTLVALFLVAFPIFDISKDLYLIYQPRRAEQISGQEQGRAVAPDIYYIILDAYVHRETLEDAFGFDNSAFYDYLSEKGFYVIPESRSNYTTTVASLASSLNMKYLTEEDGISEDIFSDAKLVNLIANNEVYKFLKGQEYTIVSIDSGFFSFSFGADIPFRALDSPACGSAKRFLFEFLKSAAPRISASETPSSRGECVLYALDKLREMPASNIPRPLFIFTHILAPHHPYNLDQNCNIVSSADDTVGYIDKLLCVNKKITKFVDEALAKSSAPPIIILQSDHGGLSSAAEGMTGSGLSLGEAQGSLRNFIALYLPNEKEKVIPPDLTPVNIFRLIFNHYFGADYELLEDKSYFVCRGGCSDTRGELKFLFDVTEEVKF